MVKISEPIKCTKNAYSDTSCNGYAGYKVTVANSVSHSIWSVEEYA
jgi:hypothetical protein